jgi:adenylate kinase
MNLVLIGKNGSGKGTLANLLREKYKIPHISTGEIFREEVSQETDLGKKVREYMDKSILVPDEITIEIVKERLKKRDCKKGYILDGFPRTIAQAEALDDITELDAAIVLDVTDKEIVRRLANRYLCNPCNIIYGLNNSSKKKGICDKCGETLYQREDDKPTNVRKRLKIFAGQFKPMMNHYLEQGKLYLVNGEGKSEKVLEDVVKYLDSLK